MTAVKLRQYILLIDCHFIKLKSGYILVS